MVDWTKENLSPGVHPGRILRRELKARQLSANALARALRVPSGRIVDILNGKRSITAETALRLGRYFGNAPQFWINLQARYDLAVAMRDVGSLVAREVQTAA
jgi:addiction module HigA family antidote